MKYTLALISILLGSFAQYLLKLGMNGVMSKEEEKVTSILKNAITNLPLISGILCYGLSMIFWLYVLSEMELGKAYPMVSLGYVFTIILGYWFLGESLNLNKIIGVLLIVGGVLFITKG